MSSYIGYSQCGDVVLGTYSYEIFPPASQLSPVVQQVDDTIQRINLYPMDTVVLFSLNTYPLDSDLPGGYCYPAFE